MKSRTETAPSTRLSLRSARFLERSRERAAAALKGESISVAGDGMQFRTFCYVSDTLAGIIGAAETEVRGIQNQFSSGLLTDGERYNKVVDIWAEVQDQISLDKLNATIRSHYAHMRAYAKQQLVAIGPKASRVAMRRS